MINVCLFSNSIMDVPADSDPRVGGAHHKLTCVVLPKRQWENTHLPGWKVNSQLWKPANGLPTFLSRLYRIGTLLTTRRVVLLFSHVPNVSSACATNSKKHHDWSICPCCHSRLRNKAARDLREQENGTVQAAPTSWELCSGSSRRTRMGSWDRIVLRCQLRED